VLEVIALSLANALFWGLADFGAGWNSRKVGALTTLLWVQGTGAVLVGIVVVATGEGLPDGRTALYAALAGAAGVSALGAFYRALAIGTMSIVAPITATGAVLPVIVGIASGDDLGAIVAAGLVLALAGVMLASRQPAGQGERPKDSRTAILLALAAAVGFGCYYVFSDVAADGSLIWLLVIGRATVLPVVAWLAHTRGGGIVPGDRRRRGALMAVGLSDLTAMLCLGLAATRGSVAVVSVISSLYPMTTVILARLVLKERMSAVQAAGVFAALSGIALVSAG
jgi:drug/metabolite transporter (DMT)-like permease